MAQVQLPVDAVIGFAVLTEVKHSFCQKKQELLLKDTQEADRFWRNVTFLQSWFFGP